MSAERQAAYTCDKCGKEFSRKDALVRHCKKKIPCDPHENANRLTCDVCGLVFDRKSNYDRHNQRKHAQPLISPAWDEDPTFDITREVVDLALSDPAYPRMLDFISAGDEAQSSRAQFRGACETLCSLLNAYYSLHPSEKSARLDGAGGCFVFTAREGWVPAEEPAVVSTLLHRLTRRIRALVTESGATRLEEWQVLAIYGAADHYRKGAAACVRACIPKMRAIFDTG